MSGKACLRAALVIVLLCCSACTYAMKKFPATDFFSGQQLVLAQAIEDGDIHKVQQLAPATDLNTPGHKHITLLFFALQEALKRDPKQLAMITALVRAGANPQQQVPNLGSLLDVALNTPQPEFLRALLDGGLDPNTMIDGDEPILFCVAQEPTFESLKLLVERGADINRRDSLRNTALYEALAAYSLDQVDYLLDHGANPNTWNVNGLSFAAALSTRININASAPDSITYKKLVEIRDRIIRLGVQWPPETPEQIRARWGEVNGDVDDRKHVR
jgi:ankyrin repeat protein